MTEHIQINPVAPRVAYVADGVQSAFTYPFAIFTPTDIEVWLGEIPQNSGFSVSGAGISTGGAVLFAVPPDAGSRVTLRRRLAIARTSDFQADGIIRAKTLNDEFDIQTAALQQVADDAARAVMRAVTSGSAADLTLPEPAPGQAIGWNADGSGLTNDPGGLQGLAATIAQQTAAAIAAAQAAGASATQASAAAAAASGDMRGANNLSDLTDAELARTTLGAAAAGHIHDSADITDLAATIQAAIDQQPTTDIDARLAFLEINLAVNTLRDQIDSGWSVLKMVDGVADEFEDTAGIGSSDGTYDATGDYIHNPGGTAMISQATGTVFGNYTRLDGYGGGNAVLFDGVTSAASGTSSGLIASYGNAYAGKDYTGSPKTVVSAKIYATTDGAFSDSGSSLTWELQYASSQGGSWTSVGSTTAVSANSAIVTITASSPPSANCWRIYCTNASDTRRAVEVEFYETTSPANITVVSTATTAVAGTTGTEARIVLLHQPVDAVTLNTDATIEVSRDGGTTWTSGTLTHEGAFDTTTNILTATIDLTAQPAGTSMKWRFKTFNAKHQCLHGVWMQWR